MSILHRVAVVVALVAAAPFGCAPGCAGALDLGPVQIELDDDAGLLHVREGDRSVVDLPITVSVRTHTAGYEAQFGMFDIVEDAGVPRVARHAEITGRDAQGMDLRFTDDSGAVVATGRIGLVDEPGSPLAFAVQAQGDAGAVTLAMDCRADDHFLGLGAQTADVDHRGQVVPLWVSEQGIGKNDDDELPTVWQLVGRRHTTHVPMPAMLVSRGLGVVVDTPAFARFDLCAGAPDRATFDVWQPQTRMLFFVGDTPLHAQQAMNDWLGRPRLPPPWMHAPWTDALFGSDAVRASAQRLRDEKIPTGAIWSEDWRGGKDVGDLYRLDEDWDLDRAQYPDYEQMTADLAAQGIAHQVYFNTFVTEGGDVHDDIVARGFAIKSATDGSALHFTGPDREFSPTALLDLTNADARNYMKGKLATALGLGARGWMADYAEWMPVDGAALSSGEDPALVHNRYPVLWQQVNREARDDSGHRDDTVVYFRSGHLGSPPLVDVLWAGDQRTSFQPDDGLPTILPIGIGTATTGFPFFAHDVGGYQSATNDPTTKELFLRWASLGAFSPVMRTHHGTRARDNVQWFTDDDTVAHWKRYAQLHIRLYPYLRALAIAAASTDGGGDPTRGAGHGPLPLWVPLPLLFPHDDVWAVRDEVMLGPSLLIAPVVTEGATTRSVRFPSTRWTPLPGTAPDAVVVNGPVDVEVAAPPTEIPVFVVAGGIVPMTTLPADTLLEVDDPALADLSSTQGDRTVVVGLGAAGSFVEEDGSTYTLEGTGTTPPTSNEPDGAIVVVGDATVQGDGFVLRLTGHPATRTTRVVLR